MTLAVLVLAGSAPTAASAFRISAFSVTPSTKQAAGHPDVKVSLNFSTGFGEDVRDLTLHFPPGLIGNPETKAKCAQSTFSADNCSLFSRVGSASVVATALGLPLAIFGTVYVLQPSPNDAATLGIVLRPTGDIPLVSKIFAVAHITVAPTGGGDYFLRTKIADLPRTGIAVGFVPVPITIDTLTLTLTRTGNAAGTYFLTNPTGCQTATSAVQAVSYDDQNVSAQSSYTPANCSAVPFTPGMSFTTTSTQAGSRTGANITLTVPGNESPLRQSHVKSAVARFPPGMNLDILAALGVPVCSESNFAADTCQAGSRVGDATVAIPSLPPDFTGDVYRVAPVSPTDAFGLGVVLRGPRGIKATLRGGAAITSVLTPTGYVVQLVSTFPTLPQIPFTSFRLGITLPMFFNSTTCGTENAEAALAGWSGASANLTTPYTTVGC
jgi:hypothetical protein